MGGYVLSKELINRILEEIGLESIANCDIEEVIDEDIYCEMKRIGE
jgi:hypothetical protein